MNKLAKIQPILFSVMLLIGTISTTGAATQPGSCFIKANTKDVYVMVYELDRNGNMGNVIWQDRINKGQEVFITVPHARFRYFYNDDPDIDQPLSGGGNRWCDGKRTVGVP